MAELGSGGDGRRARARGDQVVGREPPHSVELERTVLAVLLDGRHATAIHVVREACPHPLHFYVRDHRLIYQACLDIDDEGERVDAAGVVEKLRQSGFQVALERLRHQQLLQEADQLDGMSRAQRRGLYRWRDEDAAGEFQDSCLAAVGGFAAIADIAGAYSSGAGIRRNAQVLADYYHKRRLIGQLTRLADSAYRTTEGFEQLIDQAGTAVLHLSRLGQGGNQVSDMSTTVDDTIEAIVRQNEDPHQGVLTGYDKLDDMLMSLRPGGLYVLAARPGVGKTSFALSMVQHVCGDSPDPKGALFFSLEVDRVDLVKKLLCGKARVSFKALERGLVEEHEFTELERQAEEIRNWKLDLVDVSDLTVQSLRSVVKRHMLERQEQLHLVVIDYLQLLSSARADINEYEKISEISRTLKILAREMNVPVVALSQMSRESERAAGKPREPRLSDLRGSGSIEQDADAVLFLHRVTDTQEQAPSEDPKVEVKLIVAKNRFGPQGSVPLHFFPARQRFVPVATEEWQGGGAPAPVERNGRLEQAPADDEDLFV